MADKLHQLPLRISREALERRLHERRDWLIDQWRAKRHATAKEAANQVDATLTSLMEGWREPLLRRPSALASFELEAGVPLRAIVAYLFAEVVKNARLLHHPEPWIETVRRSQGGDRCYDNDPTALPDTNAMMDEAPCRCPSAGPTATTWWRRATAGCLPAWAWHLEAVRSAGRTVMR